MAARGIPGRMRNAPLGGLSRKVAAGWAIVEPLVGIVALLLSSYALWQAHESAERTVVAARPYLSFTSTAVAQENEREWTLRYTLTNVGTRGAADLELRYFVVTQEDARVVLPPSNSAFANDLPPDVHMSPRSYPFAATPADGQVLGVIEVKFRDAGTGDVLVQPHFFRWTGAGTERRDLLAATLDEREDVLRALDAAGGWGVPRGHAQAP